MKIAIIGATGKEGTLLVKEALTRGHEVTAIVRDRSKIIEPKAKVLEKDLFDLTYEDIKELLSKIFGKKSNGYFLGWVNSINENDTNDLYRLCKNVDSLVEEEKEVKDRFNGVINDVKKIVDNYNRSH